MDKKVFALCALSLALMTSSAYAKTLRVGYNHPNDHPTGMAMLKFAEQCKPTPTVNTPCAPTQMANLVMSAVCWNRCKRACWT